MIKCKIPINYDFTAIGNLSYINHKHVRMFVLLRLLNKWLGFYGVWSQQCFNHTSITVLLRICRWTLYLYIKVIIKCVHKTILNETSLYFNRPPWLAFKYGYSLFKHIKSKDNRPKSNKTKLCHYLLKSSRNDWKLSHR
jgi:hypothetical protein